MKTLSITVFLIPFILFGRINESVKDLEAGGYKKSLPINSTFGLNVKTLDFWTNKYPMDTKYGTKKTGIKNNIGFSSYLGFPLFSFLGVLTIQYQLSVLLYRLENSDRNYLNMISNEIGISYELRYWKNQVIYPEIGYSIGFNAPFEKFKAAGDGGKYTSFTGRINILLDFFAPRESKNLYEYGIRNTYLSFGYQNIKSMNKKTKYFEDQIISAGLKFLF